MLNTHTHPPHPRRLLAIPALLAMVVLTSCSAAAPERSTANAAAGRSIPAVSLPSPPPSLPTVGTGAGGAGSITAAVTSPISVSGYIEVPVECVVGPRSYAVSVNSAVIEGNQVGFTLRVVPFGGAGDYVGTITVTVVSSDGSTTIVGPLPQVPVTITETGGNFEVSATGSGGRTVTASLTWACSL